MGDTTNIYEEEFVSSSTPRQSTKGIERPNYSRRLKPPYSYAEIISRAIRSSVDQKLTLHEIFHHFESNFTCFTGPYKGWRNSIRHNLSAGECFKKILRDENKPNGKDNFWKMNSDCKHCKLVKQTKSLSGHKMQTTTKRSDNPKETSLSSKRLKKETTSELCTTVTTLAVVDEGNLTSPSSDMSKDCLSDNSSLTDISWDVIQDVCLKENTIDLSLYEQDGAGTERLDDNKRATAPGMSENDTVSIYQEETTFNSARRCVLARPENFQAVNPGLYLTPMPTVSSWFPDYSAARHQSYNMVPPRNIPLQSYWSLPPIHTFSSYFAPVPVSLSKTHNFPTYDYEPRILPYSNTREQDSVGANAAGTSTSRKHGKHRGSPAIESHPDPDSFTPMTTLSENRSFTGQRADLGPENTRLTSFIAMLENMNDLF